MKTKFLLAVCIFTLCSLLSAPYSFGQYTKLLDFAGATNGKNSEGDLISDGTFLYGMTSIGGTNNLGTIFKIKPDGTGYVKLLDFAGATNGSTPLSSLFSDGTFLYGMTNLGGTNGIGCIFKIKPDGTGYLKLLDFNNTNGANPYGSFISDGTFLYGTTKGGGTNGLGTVFKIKPDGTGFVTLLNFSGNANGSNPRGTLLSDGTFLYGMTELGGTNIIGVIFKIKPDGTGYLKLLNFSGVANGRYPAGSFISDGTFLYGMSTQGGTNNIGCIFKIMPNGTGFSKLYDFAIAPDGSTPYGTLKSDGTFLYGMTYSGGAGSKGTIFKIKPNGTGYATLLSFSGTANGSNPYGSFYFSGGYLYGMNFNGGANNDGTVFKFYTLVVDNINSTMVNCFGGNNGTATANVGGGISPYTYTWNTSPAQTTQTATGLTAGNYTVTVTDANSITTTATVAITQPATLVANPGTAKTICSGSSTTIGGAATGGTSPYTYAWNPSASLNSSTAVNPTASPTITTTYTETVTDSKGCTASNTVKVTVNILSVNPTSASASPASICKGSSTTISVVGGSLGTGASWKWYSTNCGTTLAGTGSSITVAPTTTKTYYVRAEGTCNNTTCATVTVTISNPTITITKTNVSCNGGNNGTATATPSGGTSPFTYLWNNSQTTQTATGLSATTFTVTITDAIGCSTSSTVAITQPTALVANAGIGKTICNGSSTTIGGTPSGGTSPYTYSWSPSASLNFPASSNPTANPTITTTYTETVTDSKGCTASNTVTVTVNNLSANPTSATASPVKICKGSSDTLTVVGGSLGTGASWKWYSTNCGTTLAGTGSSITVAPTTTKTYYVRAEGTCNNTTCASVTVTVSSPSVTVSKTNVSCNGGSNGSATATPSGGIAPYSYLWSNSGTTSQISNLTSQTYSVTITDAIGCTVSSTVSITQPTALSVSTTSTNVKCNGGNNGSAIASVSGGTSPYTYLWSTSATTAQVTNLTSQIYTVTITDAKNCVDTATVSISQPAVLTDSMSATDASSCSASDGSASATVSGGISPYTYSWNPSGQTSQTATGLPADTFIVTISDSAGCILSDTAIVSCVTGISSSFMQDLIQVYPNPTSGKFQVAISSSSSSQYKKVEIYNVLGEKIFAMDEGTLSSRGGQWTDRGGNTNYPITQLTIDLSDKPSGIYFIQIKTEQGTINKKLIISR